MNNITQILINQKYNRIFNYIKINIYSFIYFYSFIYLLINYYYDFSGIRRNFCTTRRH